MRCNALRQTLSCALTEFQAAMKGNPISIIAMTEGQVISF